MQGSSTVIARTLLSKCKNCLFFKIYTENRCMGTLSLAIVSSSISIAIGDGTETRSIGQVFKENEDLIFLVFGNTLNKYSDSFTFPSDT